MLEIQRLRLQRNPDLTECDIHSLKRKAGFRGHLSGKKLKRLKFSPAPGSLVSHAKYPTSYKGHYSSSKWKSVLLLSPSTRQSRQPTHCSTRTTECKGILDSVGVLWWERLTAACILNSVGVLWWARLTAACILQNVCHEEKETRPGYFCNENSYHKTRTHKFQSAEWRIQRPLGECLDQCGNGQQPVLLGRK